MPGIARDSVAEFQHKVATFRTVYIENWNDWLAVRSAAHPAAFGQILRKWQACRPNRMRRDAAANLHTPPYLDDLLLLAAPHVAKLSRFDIADAAALDNPAHVTALDTLWHVFEQLSYSGKARSGLAGSVGISKAVMLATDGKVGPAFDSNVRKALKLGKITTLAQWHTALRTVNLDIQAFERATGGTFAAARPDAFAALENGRIYDMALGPR